MNARNQYPGSFDSSGNASPVLLVPLVGVLVIAAVLRILGIGTWSLHADEFFTRLEIFDPKVDPFGMFKVMPLGYLPAWASLSIMKEGEAAYRGGAAFCGILSIILAAAAAHRLWGIRVALTVAMLIAVSAWHIYFSQYGRFYSCAFLFCSIFLFASLIGFETGSRFWLGVAAVAGGAIPYAHAHAVFFMASVYVALFILSLMPDATRALRPKGVLGLGVIIAVLAMPWLVTILRVAGKWASGNDWNYGPVHTLLGFVNNMTLPLLTAAGFGILLSLGRGSDWKEKALLIAAILFPLAVIVLSLKISMRHDYIFPGSIAIYLLAALAVEKLSGGRMLAWLALVALILLPQLPNIVSYYSCGNRFPYREAVEKVRAGLAPGDVVLNRASGLAAHYGIPEGQTVSTSRWQEATAGAVPGASVWLIEEKSRGGGDAPEVEWFEKNGHITDQIRPKRYDYFEHELRIWKWTAGETGG